MKERTWWWLSIAMSALLVVVLAQLWSLMNRYEIEPTQLVNAEAVDAYLAENWQALHPGDGAVPVRLTQVPTGIFIR